MKIKLLVLSLTLVLLSHAQKNPTTNHTNFEFNSAAAVEEAKLKGIAPVDYAGYTEFKRREWQLANGLINSSNLNQTKKRKAVQQISTATNIDFETGDYTGWLTFSGENTLNSNGPLQSILPMTPGSNDSIYGLFSNNCNNSDTSGRQGLISSSVGIDPIGGFPLASPMGGNYVARLNRYCQLSEGSVLEQSFTVTANQTWLNYAYAVVLEDGGHMQGEQTYFTAYVSDSAGNVLPCCVTYMQAANGQTPGFYPVNSTLLPATYYKPWTPVSIDLNAYIGQTVTVHFIASACIYGGHSGYAYVDAKLDSVAGPSVVWPGDMNYDLTADMQDLLYLGWAFNAFGSVRNAATTNWQAEISANWNQSGPYGVDFKHADADGNGLVDLNDTTAMLVNFGLNHPYRVSNTSPIQSVRSITMIPSSTTIIPGQTFYLDIDLGSSGISTADSLFHISFNVNTPIGMINNLQAADWSNSFTGNKNTSMTGIAKDLISTSNTVPVGIVRLNQTNVIGSGNLVRLYFKAGNWLGTQSGIFSIDNIVLTTHEGSNTIVNGSNISLTFANGTSGISANNAFGSIILYPNPSKEIISVSGLKGDAYFEVFSMLGEKLSHSKYPVIDISSLAKGNYFLSISTSEGTVVRKFLKE